MPHILEADLNHVLAHTAGVWENFLNARLFITGGTGFVGTWLLESFIWANQHLNLNAKAVVLTRNRERLLSEPRPGVKFILGDAVSFVYPEGQFEFVIHAATDRGLEAGRTFMRDVEATRRVLDFAATHGTKRLLFTSSGAVYGKQPPGLTHLPEEYSGAPATTDPLSGYGQAKRASEFLCSMYARQFGFAAVIARLFAFSGPYLPLDANFAVGNFVRDALRGGPIQIAGDGTPYRSYLYAADMAIWLWTLLANGESSRPYNVGSGEPVSIRELAELVAESTVPSIEVSIALEPPAGAPVSRYVPSIERARVELGLEPWIGTGEGIWRMFAFAKAAASQTTVP